MTQVQGEEQEAMKYGDAIAELNEILTAIEADRFDLDELGEKVARAAELIRLCRSKIDATELQVRSIIEDLEDDQES